MSSQNIFESIIQPESGTLSPEHAKYILTLDFSPAQHALYEELSAKANEGLLTDEERFDLDQLLTANTMLAILQSKARVSLRQHNNTTAA